MDQGKENAIEKKILVRDSAVRRLLHGWLYLFRHEVFKMLKAEGKITDCIIENMMN